LATDASEAWRRLQQKDIDLLLLDVMMNPGPDFGEVQDSRETGLYVLRRMKQDPLLQKMPVVLLTVRGNEAEVKTAAKELGVPVVSKSEGLDKLFGTVDAVLPHST
jgi:CheY-like chemotaxis protein